MIYQQTGMMIRQTSYSESSRIITVLTENGEQVPLMVRGFNKPRNQFITLRQGYLEALFTYNRFKGMGTLNDVDVTERYKNINENFDVYTHASYVLEVVTRALEDDRPEPAFYRLLKKGFKLLDEANENYAVTSLVLILVQYAASQIIKSTATIRLNITMSSVRTVCQKKRWNGQSPSATEYCISHSI